MLACGVWALASYRHMAGIATGRGIAKERRPAKGGKAPNQGGVMERLEERWRRRQEATTARTAPDPLRLDRPRMPG